MAFLPFSAQARPWESVALVLGGKVLGIEELAVTSSGQADHGREQPNPLLAMAASITIFRKDAARKMRVRDALYLPLTSPASFFGNP